MRLRSKKSITAALLAGTLALVGAACGDDDDDATTTGGTTVEPTEAGTETATS